MANNNNDNKNTPLKPEDIEVSTAASSSSDELKVEENKTKFLSPGQMVMKRFFRSKLSMVGLVTLIILFAFSFLGPFLSPYGESQPDTSQGQTSVMDHPQDYSEKVVNYEGLRWLMDNLVSQWGFTPKPYIDDPDVAGALAANQKIASENLEELHSLYSQQDEFGIFLDRDGEEVYFEIEKKGSATTIYLLAESDDGTLDRIYNVMIIRSVSNKSINTYAAPSFQHWLGTDADGYDIFTRLMYGGRISLTLGFVVIIIETLLGILFGGLAGFFGKWVDNVIMRVVDLLNCLPGMPILLIFSAILDGMDVPEGIRIYLLMGMLSIIGWAGMARVIRGQILYLREQEYMVAAEALGLGVPRRIIKHLMPNVMPLLIVQMTLGLGGIILTESTLSYLGLGIRVPKAAWGTMISSADDPTVLRLYPNQWVPAGIMIVLAVLAFNFVGDGLRDAFDPKSRR